jgi:hypothetical protein
MVFDFAVISILVGFIRRGNLLNLADLKIERIWMIFVPLALTMVSLIERSHFHDIWLVTAGPINIVAMIFVFIVLLANRKLPGVSVAVVGCVLNTVVMAANGGKMPTSHWARMVSGSAPAGKDAIRHIDMSAATHLKFLGNIIPEPKIGPFVLGVSSIGDLLMGIGIFILIQVTMCPRKPRENLEGGG